MTTRPSEQDRSAQAKTRQDSIEESEYVALARHRRRHIADVSDQILPIDEAVAKQYAIIASVRERAGKPMPGFDALIAAVCRSRSAAVATRNVPDFDGVGIEVIDPWAAAGA